MSDQQSGQIDTVMHEERQFPPSAEFAAQAKIGSLDAYQELYDRAKADPEAFWSELAKEELHWFKPFDEVLKWQEVVLCYDAVARLRHFTFEGLERRRMPRWSQPLERGLGGELDDGNSPTRSEIAP